MVGILSTVAVFALTAVLMIDLLHAHQYKPGVARKSTVFGDLSFRMGYNVRYYAYAPRV